MKRDTTEVVYEYRKIMQTVCENKVRRKTDLMECKNEKWCDRSSVKM